MRVRLFLFISLAAMLIAPATASAYFSHVIASGESLSSIAAADGLSVSELAAANGLPAGAQLVAGETIQIPPQQTGSVVQSASTSSATVCDGDDDSDDVGCGTSAAAGSTGGSGGGSYVVQPGDTLSSIAARAGVSVASLAAANGLDPAGVLVSGTALTLSGSPSTTVAVSTPTGSAAGGGSYVVRPGDTLSAIAARAGVSVNSLAASNGLNLSEPLLVGATIHLSGSPSTASAAISQPVGNVAQGSVTDPPYPTPEVLSASQIGQVAASNGVSPSLADAIAWQESGFNNDLVSSADARGIMQILPGTWQWIQDSLNPGPPLAPASAVDNVRGGVLLLRSLLNSTGGDPGLAAAGYYQGLPSVQRNGVYPSTQQYMNSVLALRQRFGGG